VPEISGEAAGPGEWTTIDGVCYRSVVLCFLFRPSRRVGSERGAALPDVQGSSGPRPPGTREVLLGLKLTGFGTGRVVALGGKIDGTETALAAAVREVHEESGVHLEPEALHDAGRIAWSFPARPDWNMVAFLFSADAGNADPHTSEEIEPRWYALDGIPWQEMWKDAPHWLPALLAGHRVDAHIVMSHDNENVASAVVG
jgi:8-oxo-dGTP diphosphatase